MSTEALILIVVLILLLGVGGWGFNAGWSGGYYGPGGLLTVVIVALFVFILLRR